MISRQSKAQRSQRDNFFSLNTYETNQFSLGVKIYVTVIFNEQ